MAKYGKTASKRVESAVRRAKKGTLKSGSGATVRSRKQAIAIGLSEAREEGGKVPARASVGRKTGTGGARKSAKKTARKTGKSSAAKRATGGARKTAGSRSTGKTGGARKSGAARKTSRKRAAKTSRSR